MKQHKWIRVTALVAAATLFAACGSSNDTAGTTSPPADRTDEAPETTGEATDEPDETTQEPTSESGDDRADWPDRLVLGLVPSQDMEQLVLDAEELGELLGAELGIPVESVVTENYAGLVVAMQTGQAQIGMFGPIALVQAVDVAGAQVILQSVRRGAPSYHTQWFTNDPDTFCLTDVVESTNPEGNVFTYCNGTDTATTGPIGAEALALIEPGTTIAFVDEGSASGYYYPAIQLENAAGLDPFTDIDPYFAGGHPNAVLHVARGDAPVGVSFDDARNNVVEEDPEIGEKIVVFAWSDEIPNDGIAVAGDLPESLTAAITDAFLALAGSEEGVEVLQAVYSIEDLVPADLAALDVARQVAASFGG